MKRGLLGKYARGLERALGDLCPLGRLIPLLFGSGKPPLSLAI
jgi:hypothetical protein